LEKYTGTLKLDAYLILSMLDLASLSGIALCSGSYACEVVKVHGTWYQPTAHMPDFLVKLNP